MYLMRPPRPALRPFAKLLWATDGASSPACGGFAREHVLPTGDTHLVFRPESAPLRLFDGPGVYRDIAPASVNHVPLPGSDLFKTGWSRPA